MKSLYNLQWVVQKNLTSKSDLSAIRNACQTLQIQFIEVDVIPFSDKLPDFDRTQKSIFYGSTTFNKLAYENSDLK